MLQPALAAARAAWRPFQRPINQLEDELRTELRPAMWKANSQARQAGFGHRHTAARRAAEASRYVADIQARIDAIVADGQAVKERLDALDTEARTLHDVAHPAEVLSHFEDYDQRHLHTIDHQVQAVDTYIEWALGQPVAADQLADSVARLIDTADQAPHFSLDGRNVTRSQWFELLDPALGVLHAEGIEPRTGRTLEPERRGPELGLGL